MDAFTSDLRRLLAFVPSARRRQGMFVLAFMLVGAIAEFATIGAVVPFIALVADPWRFASYPIGRELMLLTGMAGPHGLLIGAGAAFAVLALGTAFIRLTLTWLSQKFIYDIGFDISTRVYETVLHQPYAYHVARNSSTLLAGIQKCTQLTSGLLLPMMQTLISLAVASFILTAMLLANPLIALAALLGFGGIYLVVSTVTRRRLRAIGRVTATMQTARMQALQEGMGHIRDVLLDNAQPLYAGKFADYDRRLRDGQASASFIGNAPRYLVESAGMIVIAALAIHLAGLPGGIAAALPALGALAVGAQKLVPLFHQSYNGWAQATSNRAALEEVLDFLDLPVVREVPGEALPFKEAIELVDLGFAYQPRQAPVLSGLHLRIPKGARIGFIGKTGSGKSTLIDIIMGLLQPTAGSLRVDGLRVTRQRQAAWQMNIAHVPQSIYLSDTSIAENIAFGVPLDEIDLARVAHAAALARIAEFVETLPQAYLTPVGERGARLSGGQRQRIGIARALYKRPTLLVLDEATSALDSETEAEVMRAIDAIGGDLTVLMVAHRLSTLGGCSQIYRMIEGQLREIERLEA